MRGVQAVLLDEGYVPGCENHETGESQPYFSLQWLMRVGQSEGRRGGQGQMAGGRCFCSVSSVQWIAVSP